MMMEWLKGGTTPQRTRPRRPRGCLPPRRTWDEGGGI